MIFFDEYHEQVLTIESSLQCYDYLRREWHLHGDISFYYDALKAVMNALDDLGSHQAARKMFIRALREVDARIVSQ